MEVKDFDSRTNCEVSNGVNANLSIFFSPVNSSQINRNRKPFAKDLEFCVNAKGVNLG